MIAPLEVANSPDGNVYVLSHGGSGADPPGTVYEVRFVGANRAPTAVASADVTSGAAPLNVAFDGSASSDPDGDALTFSWDFGDGQTAAGVATSHIYSAIGVYTAQLTVNDGQTTGVSQPITITVGNSAPTPTIALPVVGATYRA